MSATNLPLVMLIDDSEIDTFVNKKFLRVSGISDNVISFLSAQEALDYLKANANQPEKLPKFILLDIQMPGITGFQFLEIFQNTHEIKADIKIVILSSTLDPIDIERAHSNKAVLDIMKKPIDPVKLKAILGN